MSDNTRDREWFTIAREATARAEAAEAKVRDTQEMVKAAAVPHYVRRIDELTRELEQAQAGAAALREALDLAWGLIANANGGDWALATPEWKAAAERWRDNYAKADTDAGAALLGRLRTTEAQRDLLRAGTAAIADERDALRAEYERLRAFVAALRADGLDIDDPTTAPTWTGKIHDADGRLVFDLATVGTPCPKCVEAIARSDGSQPQPPTCTWCGLPIDANAVTRTDAAGGAHAFHGACYSAHADWISGLARGTP